VGGDPEEEPEVVEAPLDPANTTVVELQDTGEVLFNPGMGFSDFHFSWGDPYAPPPYPDPSRYPPSTVAYFRWYWDEIEPSPGAIDFDLIDAVIANARERSEGERLAFRVMTLEEQTRMPGWLRGAPYNVEGTTHGGIFVPDYRGEVFLRETERLLLALGERYDGHPDVDHVDIGVVGCWGEWNTACVGGQSFCALYGLSEGGCESVSEAFERIVDMHFEAFPNTPKVMLLGDEGVTAEALVHAVERGAGWRADCLGDWGFWSSAWSHMTTLYPQGIANASSASSAFPSAWTRAPVQFEVCGTMGGWLSSQGYSAARVVETFEFALEQHASVINAKSSDIPAAYMPAVEQVLLRLGYRLLPARVEHPSVSPPGARLRVDTRWENLGVAPPYHPHPVVWRLRDGDEQVVAQRRSDADLLSWLPGAHEDTTTLELPEGLPPGTYHLDAAIFDNRGTAPEVHLPLGGRLSDGWYAISTLAVSP